MRTRIGGRFLPLYGAQRPIKCLFLSITVAVLTLFPGPAMADQQVPTPSLDEMWRIIQQQQAEIDSLKRQNEQLLEQINTPVSDESTAQSVTKPPTTSTPQDAELHMPVHSPSGQGGSVVEAGALAAEDSASEAAGSRFEIYGDIMLNTGYQFEQDAPDWFDVLRPTKLPAYADEFGQDGYWFTSVRPSRLGFKSFTPTSLGELKTIFEFDLFGSGNEAGQTAFHLRQAWGELGQFGAGQTWSTFIDISVFPNTLEFWGPNGMAVYRNIQARWTPWSEGDSRFAIALERPGGSGDGGKYFELVELEGVTTDFQMPDLTSQFRWAQDWGHVQVAGILRQIRWVDNNDDPFDLSGDDLGWGINLSSNYKVGRHVLRGSVVYGQGVQNYMNDATIDIGVVENFSDPLRPIYGEAIPMLGIMAFLDLNWSQQWTSSVGYSMLDNDLPDGQTASSFKKGQYAVGNLVYYPTDNVLYGLELQWGKRDNFSDGFSSNDWRLQFSAKYSFGWSFGDQ
jgi:hypothetical protein